MATKAEQFRYRQQREKKKTKDDARHVKRSSRTSQRTAEDGSPTHEDVNLELRAEPEQRSPEVRARRARARNVRPRGGR